MGNLKPKPTTRRDADDAARLQKAGQHGDTVLAHINPQEAKLLDLLADGLLDAPRNPKTGLLSFGMSDAEGPSGHDSNPGGVGGGPAGGQTGGGLGGNTNSSSGSGGYGGSTSFGNYASDPSMGPDAHEDEIGNYSQNNGYVNWNDYAINGYAKPDTFGRLMQELVSPSVPTAKYGATTGANLGIMGAMAGMLAGGPMSGLMGIGAAMGRAQSPESQRASMAEQAATGAKNSTGNTPADLEGRASGTQYAGTTSGAETAKLPQVPPGYSVNPAGQIIPLPQQHGNNRPAYQDPLRNLLLDYVLRGRQGGGLLG